MLESHTPGSALVVVAHPDDETIWMGGTILQNTNIDWTIFALCRNYDEDRAPRFRSAAEIFRATGIISDLEDEGRLGLKASIPEIEKRLMNELRVKNFDYIFTHGSNGEYGHERHKSVHLAVKHLLQAKKLIANKLYSFAYEMHKSDKYAISQGNADFKVKLSENIFNKKLDLIQNVYGFGADSFEYKSCYRIETFNTMKI